MQHPALEWERGHLWWWGQCREVTPGGCELGEGFGNTQWPVMVGRVRGAAGERKLGQVMDGGSRKCTPEQHLLGYLKAGCNYTFKNYLARRINVVRSIRLFLLVSTASSWAVCLPFTWQSQHSPPELGFAVVFTPCPTRPVPNPSRLLARDEGGFSIPMCAVWRLYNEFK